MGDLTGALPCDFIVYRDHGFDPSRILLPTAGGPASELGASVARMLLEEFDSELTLMHVVDDESERRAGEDFLDGWAAAHGFENAAKRIEISGESYDGIRAAAGDYSLVVLGASGRGLLERLTQGSGIADTVEELDVSVLMVEPTRARSLWERLFGGRRQK